ncbi:MAG: enoyl-CoA hydratase/isomerase family protein [Aeromicrobium erythreum]
MDTTLTDQARDTEAVRLEVVDGLGIVTLARPDHGNAIDGELGAGLTVAVERLAAVDGLRAVLVRAEGPTFSLGGDIGYFRSHDPAEYGPVFGRLVDTISPAVLGLHALEVPVVTAVQGWTVGASLALVGVADVVVAADDARFRVAFTGIGLPGDVGVTWFLPRLVGPRRAAALVLENEPFGAAEALDWGLVSRLVPAADLQDDALATARRLAAGPTVAFRHARANLASAFDHPLAEHVAAERASTVDCATSHDLIQGIAAFAERRTPEFEGR